MKKLVTVVALGFATIATPAIGADLRPAMKAPVAVAPPPIWNWTGFYIGIHGGYGWGDADYRFNSAGFFNALRETAPGRKSDGGLVVGHIGSNMQFGSLLWVLNFWHRNGHEARSQPLFPATTSGRMKRLMVASRRARFSAPALFT